MTIAEQAAAFLQANRDTTQKCPYIADSLAEVKQDLSNPGVIILQAPDLLMALDQYRVDGKWEVEVWGPFGARPLEEAFYEIQQHVTHRPIQLHFFYTSKNHKMTTWLQSHGAVLTGETIWKVPLLKEKLQVAALESVPKDLNQVIALHHQLFTGEEVAIVTPNHPLFVMRQQGQVVGYASAEQVGTIGRLLYVAVRESARHQGIAAQLCRSVQADLTRRGVENITLVQSEKAIAAGDLYRSLGYQPLSTDISAILWCD
ncbi:GNAT family N-acetyltransferase [Lacticaseibacillus zhaodongensis]|uniref:GNAT family N-acetyltransferase n=1 Tax=Lacticaseibacillus zhaodongensis TaxID=2668065 RepID=UPI0012D2A2CE|nr:GNAT family N-acetyltransferase [Lacticaseibacillus zhaodongensis]